MTSVSLIFTHRPTKTPTGAGLETQMPHTYDRVAADERTRHAMEDAAWRARDAVEAAIEGVPEMLACQDGHQLLDWIARREMSGLDERLALLIEAIAHLGAAQGNAANAMGDTVLMYARRLADEMIRVKIAEVSA